MNNKPTNMHKLFLVLFLFVLFAHNIQAQDIIICDFEGTDVADWKIAGKSFGSGPASKLLGSKKGITGFKGKRYANSGYGNNSATGILISPEFTIERGYINFLICGGNWPDELKVELTADKKVVRKTSGTHQEKMIWKSWDVQEFKGSRAIITVRDDCKLEWGYICVDHFVQSDKSMYRKELYRPQFHFTPWVNWMNDPHGLVYYKGEYHLFFQHNPHARIERKATHNNTHWGHAVSPDLIHWKQLPNVLAPDELGLMFSGSAAVDFKNTAGFKTGDEDVVLAFYTASDEAQSQCLAYSNDMARTFTKYGQNPVVEVDQERRDPKVFWYEPDKKWVMALYEYGGFGFYTSKDAKNWTKMSSYGHGTGYEDCADMFELPLDGDESNTKWILHDGAVRYVLGQFDGTKFIADNPEKRVFNHGSYAYQTYNNIPASDGRTIQISWLGGPDWPDMPFNQQTTFPCELNLRTFPEGIKVCRTPVREVELLYDKKHHWENLTIKEDENLLKDIKGMLFDIQAEFEIGTASEFGFKIRGDYTVSYDVEKKQAQLTSGGEKSSEQIAPINKRVKMRILVDRSSIEAYIDEGRASFTTSFFPKKSNQTLQLFSKEGETKLTRLDIYELKSAWNR